MAFSLTFLIALATAVAAKECSEHFAEGKVPDAEGTFLCRKKGSTTFFATVYDTKVRCPMFSAYKMKPEEQKHDAYKRKGFILDPDVPADQQAHSKDTAFDSAHDIGHLAPSNDFSWDQSDNGAWEHTYMMTNVAPQGSYFNEHPWAFVEKHTREFCINHNVELYVVTGVIQASRPTMVEGDAVPEYYYKALCDVKNGQSVAFIGENTDCKECGITKNGKFILNSVSDVEKKAGYSIFPSSCSPTKVDEKFWDVFQQSNTLII
jgi:DNA/RNA endonuclease G (NUC1)